METLETYYVVSETIQVREVDDEIIVLDIEQNRFSGLDKVGAQIWNALSAGHKPAEALATLARRYPAVPRNILESDVVRLTENLCARGWIRERANA